MKRIVAADLDRTMIYSGRMNLGRDKVLVETLKGKALSFMTQYTYDALKCMPSNCLLVPVTTRSAEQYHRIVWGDARTPSFALVANGGVLLENGREVIEWREESLRLVEESREELAFAERILEKDKNRTLEVRRVDGLFVFTKSSCIEATVGALKAGLSGQTVQILENGSKVYVLPDKLHKGTALQRFLRRYPADEVIAAGDSLFDIEMLNAADQAVCPEELLCEIRGKRAITAGRDEILSDLLMRTLETPPAREGKETGK